MLRVEIADDGAGIASDRIEDLFEVFVRGTDVERTG
jgi:signal transduction histidine kinase